MSSQNEPEVENISTAASTLEDEQLIDLSLNERNEKDNDESNEVYDDAVEPAVENSLLPASKIVTESKKTLRGRTNLKPPNRYKDFVCNVCFDVNPVYNVSYRS